MKYRSALLAVALTAAPCAQAAPESPAISVVPASASQVTALPVRVVGRVVTVRHAGQTFSRRQWPGTYFETGVHGSGALFRVGEGDVKLQISVDGKPVAQLEKPKPGLYRITGLSTGDHRIRVAVASESQAAPTEFGGFYADKGTTSWPIKAPSRQIEFIGDSHTVGYGNTSTTQTCTEDDVWNTTDTAQGIAPRLAARYGADYEVNAISGRGIVRNYNGIAGDTLPQAYPYALFDHTKAPRNPLWHPQVLVIALGTNDFSTPLNPGEHWATREALHSDYEATFVRFLKGLRAANPRAFIVVWGTDLADGEIGREEGRVVQKIRAMGDERITYVPIKNLAFTGCNHHPSLTDDQVIADTIAQTLQSQGPIWEKH